MAKVRFLVLSELMVAGVEFDRERKVAKERKKAESEGVDGPRRKGKRARLKDTDPW